MSQDPYTGQWEAAAATFLDDKQALSALRESISHLVAYAEANSESFLQLVDQEFLPKMKRARGHNRAMLQEAYDSLQADPAPASAISLAYSVFVTPLQVNATAPGSDSKPS